MILFCTATTGAPVAQWVKRLPTDLAVPGSSTARGEIFSTINCDPFHTAFHYHPPVVLIWLKYCWKGRKIESHPSIYCMATKMILHLLDNGLNNCSTLYYFAWVASVLNQRIFIRSLYVKYGQIIQTTWNGISQSANVLLIFRYKPFHEKLCLPVYDTLACTDQVANVGGRIRTYEVRKNKCKFGFFNFLCELIDC